MNHPHPPVITTRSAADTAAIGQLLGQLAPPNTCIALHGNLGAGKTQLTRGLVLGAKVDDPTLVSSPTYVLLNIYPGHKTVYHLDAYRIGSERDFEAVGLDELLSAGGLVVIEWAERIPDLLPADVLHIHLEAGDLEDERQITLSPTGPLSTALAQAALSAIATAAPPHTPKSPAPAALHKP